jgi:hypothetical protein
MDLIELKTSLSDKEMPPDLPTPLAALCKAATGNWDAAHRLVQDDDSSDAAWVHAYLHRVEGDLSNAAYWYRRAGKPVATGELQVEWDAVASALLAGSA